jgi:hypothetical protein
MYDNQRWEPDYRECWQINNPEIPCSGPARWLGCHHALGRWLVPACDAHIDGMEQLEPFDGSDQRPRQPRQPLGPRSGTEGAPPRGDERG